MPFRGSFAAGPAKAPAMNGPPGERMLPPGSGNVAETRAGQRTNLFLSAVLSGPQFSSPVRLRNMSSEGALAEAASVPPVGSEVRLVRGSLAVPATVVWSGQGRCGLHFSSLVSVREWLAPPANQDQQRVDEAVRLLKAGAVPLAPQAAATKGGGGDGLGNGLGSDLTSIARLLELLTEHLAGNEATVLAHAADLPDLDIAVQTLNALADGLAGDRDDPSKQARLASLRASYRRALERGGGSTSG